MIFTLMLGAPVRSGDHRFGTVTRVILNNGVANQFVVNPSGLFSGPERVVPISDIEEATAEGVTVDISDVEWKAYGAFNLDQIMAWDRVSSAQRVDESPRGDLNTEVVDRAPSAPDPSAEDLDRTASAVVLTNKTQVGHIGKLAGLVIDTGIPKELLVDNGASIPFDLVGVLDEEHITLGEPQPRRDSVTPPSSVGQETIGRAPTTDAAGYGKDPR